ncbi:MAG: heparinase II/III family protein [Armatimonadetes bacterium]|nr:heparinase II/III family protein [Armatimonadota bacterium]
MAGVAAAWAWVAVLAADSPVLPPRYDAGNLAWLKGNTTAILALDEAHLLALVPTQGGMYFCGCPNCNSGRQEGQLNRWSLDDPDHIKCEFCGQVYPSDKYPAAGTEEHAPPGGGIARYPYWADAKGYRFYFQARADDARRIFCSSLALQLAALARLSDDAKARRYAALLVNRFAEVYPNYCLRFDYPFQPKVIEDGQVPAAKFRPGFRTARWSWWAYMDVPIDLVQAYDLTRDTGIYETLGAGTRQRIEDGLFRVAVEQVLANPETYSNMGPTAWYMVLAAGRVLGEPRYVHVPLDRLRHFVAQGFFYDGAWSEGAPSYHSQVLGSLSEVARYARGYSDPPGYQPPAGETRLDDADILTAVPQFGLSRATLAQMALPDGRYVPVHDTWANQAVAKRERSEPYLLGALGHACLARGEGEAQVQTHLTWSGKYGHQHADGLSLLLYTHGQELLSDIGYTHTAYRAWTLATLAHNTVLIDTASQVIYGPPGSGTGTLRWCDLSSPAVQAVSADNPTCYPGLAETYRRTVLQIALDDGGVYLVDRFDVAGGARHDYLLWGSTDRPQTLALEPAAEQPILSLVPAGVEWTVPKGEGDFSTLEPKGAAYSFLREIRRAGEAGALSRATFTGEGAGLRATLLTAPGDELFTVACPAIRPAGENDANLEKSLRRGVLWRRQAAQSRFVAVVEPFAPASRVAVERLELPGCEAALRVTLPGGRRDVILLGAQAARLTEDGLPLAATGEVVVVTLRVGRAERIWLAGPGRVTAGDASAEARAPESLPVTGYETSALVVKGTLAAPAGTILMVRHGDGSVSPYTLAGVEPAGNGQMRLKLREQSGFRLDADGTAKALTHPMTDRPGPHEVVVPEFGRWQAAGGRA